jgi:multisubunit Na+/H+ antiporter MnhF subunit
MEVTFSVLFWLYAVATAAAALVAICVIPYVYRNIKRPKLADALRGLNAGDSRTQAKSAVALVKLGFFTRTAIGNHGKNFPDGRQCADFLETMKDPRIAVAAKEIGDSLWAN